MPTTEQNINCLEKMKFRDTANPDEVCVAVCGELNLANGASAATTENSAVGSTLIYSDTLINGVNLTLPIIAGNFINSFILENIGVNNIELSFNGIAPFYILTPNNNFAWTCQATKQITLKGDGDFQMIINFSGVS